MTSDVFSNLVSGLSKFLGNPQIWTGTYIKNVNNVGNLEVAKVASTCLSKVTYNHISRQLGVTFKDSGSSYVYYNVDEQIYEELVTNLTSVGETYNDTIKGVYPYTRIS